MKDIDQNDAKLAMLCKALGHVARVKIVRHLLKVNACYFGDLTEVLDLAPSTVSQHVSALKKAGIIIEGQKDCRSCHCLDAKKLVCIKALIDTLSA